MWLFHFLCFLIACFGKVKPECDSPHRKSAEAVLREKLFCNYNKNVRPVPYFSNQTVVQVELYPLKIFMNEYEEMITIHGNIEFVWSDTYLQWDPKEYEDIQVLSVIGEEIWLPDIAIDASLDGLKISPEINTGDCLITHMGRVLCFPVNTINAYCSPDLLHYPFDRHNCSLIFIAPSYSGTHLNLKVFDSGVKMSLYRPNKIWEIVNISLKREVTHAGMDDNSTFYPYLKCNIILQRHAAEHQVIIIIPGFVFACLTLLTFCMNDMFSSRIYISGISFLSNVLYCLYLGRQVPSNGDQVPLVVTFFRDSLLLSGFAIVIATLVQHLHGLSTLPYSWLSDFVSKLEGSPLGKIMLREAATKEDDTTEIIPDNKSKVTVWCQLATVIDRIAFCICFLIYVILFIFYMP